MKRIKIELTKPTVPVPINNQHNLNGFIHESFGTNNPYHDKFSDYSISSLQGGRLNDDRHTLNFDTESPHFFISSDNEEFLMFAVQSFIVTKASMFGMKFHTIGVFDDFKLNKYYDDVITISPIIVKNKEGKKITIEDDDFIYYLTENCKKKLLHKEIVDPTLKIEIINPHKAKSKCVWVGNVFNPCSMVRLRIYGTKQTRSILYNMGLGGSTGSGFGAIKMYSK